MSADQIRRTPTGSWTVTDAWGQPPCHSRAVPYLYVQNCGVLPSTATQSAPISALRCHHRKKASLLKNVPTAGSSLIDGVPSRVADTEPTDELPPGDQQNKLTTSSARVRVSDCVDSIELLRKDKKKKKSLSKTSEKQKVDWKKVRRRLKKTIYSLSEEDLNLLYRLYQVKYKDSAPQVPAASYDNLVELFWREANGTLLSVTKLFNLLHVMKKIERERRHKDTKRSSSSRVEQDAGDQSSDSSTCVRKRTPRHRRSAHEESKMFCTIL